MTNTVDRGLGEDYVGFDVLIFYTFKDILVTQMYILIKNHEMSGCWEGRWWSRKTLNSTPPMDTPRKQLMYCNFP